MMDTFEKLLAGLCRCDVDYILVGGLAVALCGYVRATMDVDILVRADSANVARMLACLQRFGEGAARELAVEDFAVEEGAIRIVEDFPLDVFTLMNGQTYEDLLPLTALHEVEDVAIRHLTPEGLIRLKAGSLRPKDRLDVEALQAILRGERF